MGIWHHWYHCGLRDQRASLKPESSSFPGRANDLSPKPSNPTELRGERRTEQLPQELAIAAPAQS
jgi:hypothetical protein